MKEHFYALYLFTVQSNGGVSTPLLVDFEDLPYPQEGPIHSGFAHQNYRKGCPGSG